MSNAVSSSGTLLKLGDGAGSEVFTTIAEVRDIDGPGFSQGTEEVTSHDSNRRKEYIATLLDGGEVSFDLNFFAHATQGPTGGLYEAFIDGEDHNFQMVLTTTGDDQINFAAIVTAFEFTAPVEGVLTAECTLQLTGDWTWS